MKFLSYVALLGASLALKAVALPLEVEPEANTTYYPELRKRSGWSISVQAGAGTVNVATDIAAVSRRADQLDMFCYGTWNGQTGAQHWYWANGGNWNRQLIPGQTGGGLAAITRAPNLVELFWPWDNEGIKSMWWQEPNTNPSFTDQLKGTNCNNGCHIRTITRSSDNMELFWVGAEGQVVHSYWSAAAGWRWSALYVPASSSKAAQRASIATVSRHSGHMEAFWSTRDYTIMHAWWDTTNGWKVGELLSASKAMANPYTGIAAISRSSDTMNIFFTQNGGTIGQAYWTSADGWRTGTITSMDARPGAIAAATRHSSNMEVVWTGYDGSIRHAYWGGSTWASEQLPGGSPGTAYAGASIALVSRASNTVEGWTIGRTGELIHFYWYA